jgi:hypothetical protein
VLGHDGCCMLGNWPRGCSWRTDHRLVRVAPSGQRCSRCRAAHGRSVGTCTHPSPTWTCERRPTGASHTQHGAERGAVACHGGGLARVPSMLLAWGHRLPRLDTCLVLTTPRRGSVAQPWCPVGVPSRAISWGRWPNSRERMPSPSSGPACQRRQRSSSVQELKTASRRAWASVAVTWAPGANSCPLRRPPPRPWSRQSVANPT